ncbi:hypothetical protein G647_07334 [Cladophialophora carrionii CBS 160.54]|uniref:Uncharacterized protein n=1 Tax=Cladophialophora carrionii CBS 160.54 TaxID=1279043 RepID=V9D2Y5_9EURO|nr:uncharacterized protein G647_07334 [Cladophialophora carrionii CBS 160.54]ETI20991.1 hypothetical protein G647_07334 [Cladophialophora carrionii CBS 160.54]
MPSEARSSCRTATVQCRLLHMGTASSQQDDTCQRSRVPGETEFT